VQLLAASLLAGHGGEEELRLAGALDLHGDPWLPPSCVRWSGVPGQYSLTCRGGEEGSGRGVSVLRCSVGCLRGAMELLS
jgi:hypothetical protein